MFRTFAAAAISTAIAAAIASPALADPGIARMKDANGNDVGVVNLAQGPDGVLISAHLQDLPPGTHAFHIHETGKCGPDFGAAGGHFNPEGKGHGLLVEGGHHAGDLPNIHVGADGKAVADAYTSDVTLGKGPNSLFDDDGSAIIVHENADTYREDAGAGGRIACGVIETD